MQPASNLYLCKLQHTLQRELPKALTTTSIWKLIEGTRLIVEPNGNNVKDEQWEIRSRESTSDMIG